MFENGVISDGKQALINTLTPDFMFENGVISDGKQANRLA